MCLREQHPLLHVRQKVPLHHLPVQGQVPRQVEQVRRQVLQRPVHVSRLSGQVPAAQDPLQRQLSG